jgi:hypothetical protein
MSVLLAVEDDASFEVDVAAEDFVEDFVFLSAFFFLGFLAVLVASVHVDPQKDSRDVCLVVVMPLGFLLMVAVMLSFVMILLT